MVVAVRARLENGGWRVEGFTEEEGEQGGSWRWWGVERNVRSRVEELPGNASSGSSFSWIGGWGSGVSKRPALRAESGSTEQKGW